MIFKLIEDKTSNYRDKKIGKFTTNDAKKNVQLWRTPKATSLLIDIETYKLWWYLIRINAATFHLYDRLTSRQLDRLKALESKCAVYELRRISGRRFSPPSFFSSSFPLRGKEKTPGNTLACENALSLRSIPNPSPSESLLAG